MIHHLRQHDVVFWARIVSGDVHQNTKISTRGHLKEYLLGLLCIPLENLLRICSQFSSDFTLVYTVVGEYYYKNDGSNAVPTGWGDDERVRAGWNEVAASIEQRRRTTPIAAPIQRALGLADVVPELTIRNFLDHY